MARRPKEDKEWTLRNHRRVCLIRKSSTSSLTPEEEAELKALDEELVRRLEPMDKKLLEGLRPLLEAVDRLKREAEEKSRSAPSDPESVN